MTEGRTTLPQNPPTPPRSRGGKLESENKHETIGAILLAVMLVLTAQISLANSATWLSSPQDSAWENPNNWTPGGPPNGPSDIATFAHSSGTNVDISTSVEVNSIVFTSDSFSFFIGDDSQLIISGAGINNNNIPQSFTNYGEGLLPAARPSSITHRLQAAPPSPTTGYPPGTTIFNDTSTAGSATITNGAFPGSQTIFNDTSTAANATITNDGHYFDQDGARLFLTIHRLRPVPPSPIMTLVLRQSSTIHRLPTAHSLSLTEVTTMAVRFFLMVLRPVAPRGSGFLIMVT